MIELAPAGDRALLANLGEVTAHGLHAAAAAVRALPRVIACIPGHSSLYVIFEGPSDSEAVRSAVASSSNQQPATSNHSHTIPIDFTGPDLPELLAHTGLSRDEFLARVDGLRLTARYLGFRGGFAYLDGWPAEWAMPRRPTSRPVPRGSFAIAGNVAGFYPIDSPGGWNLLGVTDVELENRFAAGDEIVVSCIAGVSRAPRPDGGEGTRGTRALHPAYDILFAPLATLVTTEDWSRVARGLSPGGPFDDVAAALVNAAVSNAPGTPVLECAMTGPRLRFREDKVVAWWDGRVEVERVRAGQEWGRGRIVNGLRGYLAVGDREGVQASVERSDRLVIRAMRGPHDAGLAEIVCTVTPKLDRVGIRLQPLQMMPAVPADLKSCGMQCGTVQLHPDGSLVVMGPDHPVTGGYLQPMTVLQSERWKLAQLVPGERVRLVAD